MIITELLIKNLSLSSTVLSDDGSFIVLLLPSQSQFCLPHPYVTLLLRLSPSPFHASNPTSLQAISTQKQDQSLQSTNHTISSSVQILQWFPLLTMARPRKPYIILSSATLLKSPKCGHSCLVAVSQRLQICFSFSNTLLSAISQKGHPTVLSIVTSSPTLPLIYSLPPILPYLSHRIY